MAYKVGIDIGGTFTDLYAYDTQTGKSLCLSSSSTPENYANGVLNVIEKSKIHRVDSAWYDGSHKCSYHENI